MTPDFEAILLAIRVCSFAISLAIDAIIGKNLDTFQDGICICIDVFDDKFVGHLLALERESESSGTPMLELDIDTPIDLLNQSFDLTDPKFSAHTATPIAKMQLLNSTLLNNVVEPLVRRGENVAGALADFSKTIVNYLETKCEQFDEHPLAVVDLCKGFNMLVVLYDITSVCPDFSVVIEAENDFKKASSTFLCSVRALLNLNTYWARHINDVLQRHTDYEINYKKMEATCNELKEIMPTDEAYAEKKPGCHKRHIACHSWWCTRRHSFRKTVAE